MDGYFQVCYNLSTLVFCLSSKLTLKKNPMQINQDVGENKFE